MRSTNRTSVTANAAIVVTLCHVLAGCSSGQPDIDTVFAQYFEDYLALFPTEATSVGDHRFDDRLEISISDAHRSRQKSLIDTYLGELDEVDRKRLSGNRQLSYDVLRYKLEDERKLLAYPSHLMPISFMDCFPDEFALWGKGEGDHPFETAQDYRNFIRRMGRFALWVDTAIANMRRGIEEGVVLPRVVTRATIALIEPHVAARPDESPFYEPLRNMPDSISAAGREKIAEDYEAAIREFVLPSYRELVEFLESEYLPSGRDSVAWSALPDGRAWYLDLVRSWTTMATTPDEIHELGVREVERIFEELTAARSAPDSQERVVYDSEEELLEAYGALLARTTPQIEPYFGELPIAPLEIRPTHRGAHYRPGSEDGKRSGAFMVYTVGLEAKPQSVSEALFFHEAVPGHHYQIALQQGADLPRFRRNLYFYAYQEGWGLYAEGLAEELNLYSTPDAAVDRLSAEMVRALRLVVDTGIHWLGWTAEEAADYFERYYGYRPGREIVRYISLPGQALTYKLGELRLRELRDRFGASIEDADRLREFHRRFLAPGPLPMDLLEAQFAD